MAFGTEITNQDNVERVDGIARLIARIGEPGEDRANVVDVLTNVMHYAATVNVDFDDALLSARNHYSAESVSMSSSTTHESGIAAAEKIADEVGISWAEIRQIASQHLSETMPDLDEIGSSDVSIHLASLGNHEPAWLRAQAEQVRTANAQ